LRDRSREKRTVTQRARHDEPGPRQPRIAPPASVGVKEVMPRLRT
jgi:hypothetical protein